MKNDPPSSKKHFQGEEESTKRHVYIEPGVQIDLVQDLKKKYETAQSEGTTHSNKILFWTKISAGLLFVYVGLTLLQAYLSHKSLEAIKEQFQMDQRPHITPISYAIFNTVTKKVGPPTIGEPFRITVELKNVGKSTALQVYIHRHLLFGKQYPAELKVEPADVHKASQVLESQAPSIYTTALSVKDTYKIESIYVPPDAFLPWDGTTPIVVFGRVTYEDALGKLYCTPFGAAYLDPTSWSNLSDFSPSTISLFDLCPPGTVQ